MQQPKAPKGTDNMHTSVRKKMDGLMDGWIRLDQIKLDQMRVYQIKHCPPNPNLEEHQNVFLGSQSTFLKKKIKKVKTNSEN